MISASLKSFKLIWHTWDIRILIVFSLIIQVILTLLAPYRKRCAKRCVVFVMWFLYLAADTVAVYAIGLISRSLYADVANDYVLAQNANVLAFWTPFLLLHLGGPDTITALALEDNELWHRHLLQLFLQVFITVYVIVQTSTRSNQLSVPMLLMFVNGCIKYTERVWALYSASAGRFRESLRGEPEPGPNYARLMEEYSSATKANIPTEIHGKDQGAADDGSSIGGSFRSTEPILPSSSDQNAATTTARRNSSNSSNHSNAAAAAASFTAASATEKVVVQAFELFNLFKGLLADSIVSLKKCEESRGVFLKGNISAQDAFRIIEIELNFIYDVFYTKVFLLQKNARYARLVSFPSLIASLLLFTFMDKSNYRIFDVGITYFLLWGALALDLLGAVIYVLSDWWIVIPSSSQKDMVAAGSSSSSLEKLKAWLRRTKSLICNKWLPGFATLIIREVYYNNWWPRSKPPPPRWSRSISSYNLLNRFLNDQSAFALFRCCPCLCKMKRVDEFFVKLNYVYPIRIDKDDQLQEFIMKDLKRKAMLANDLESTKKVCAARGNFALDDHYFLISEFLRPWTMDVDYDESVLIWHLATNICYSATDDESTSNSSTDDHGVNANSNCDPVVTANTNRSNSHYRDMSKLLSDYMLYLLLMKQKMVSSVAGMADIRFDDTIAEAQKFLDKQDKIRQLPDGNLKVKQFCDKILHVKTDVQPIIAKGDKSKSVLFDACRLAKQLRMLKENQWEITSKVWLELLCYAAIRCPPRSHIAQLRNGGELITLVWLLMAHLGLGEHFRHNQGYGWSKLIICK